METRTYQVVLQNGVYVLLLRKCCYESEIASLEWCHQFSCDYIDVCIDIVFAAQFHCGS